MTDDPNISYHGSDAPLTPEWKAEAKQRQKKAVSRERDRRRREEAELEKRLEKLRR